MSTGAAILLLEVILVIGIATDIQCNSYCASDLYPYTNGISCVQFVTNNRLDYESSMIYAAANNHSSRINSLVLSQNSTLDLNVLSTYTASIFDADTNAAVPLWIGDCFGQCDDSLVNLMASGNCPALFNRSVFPLNCSLKLGYIIQSSFNIPNVSEIFPGIIYADPNGLMLNLQSPFNEPKFTVSWTLDDQPLHSQPFVSVLSNNSLYISTVMEDLYGIYTASVSNGFNQAAVVFAADIQQAVFIPPKASNISIPAGNLAAFKCASLKSRPIPMAVWYTDSFQPITSGGRYLVSPLGTLYIREVTLNDSGIYYCSLSNIIGEAVVAVQLDVIDKTINETTLQTQFILSPVNQSILEDEEATLECAVMSNYVITAGQIISVTNYLFEADGSFIDTVVYLPFSVSNIFPSIPYRTAALTSIRCQAQITVSNVGTQNILSDYATITPNVKASISSISESASIELGEPVSLSCIFKGVPVPEVQWYFNGQLYNTTTSANHDSSYLQLEHFTLSNVGTYQCMVANVHSVALAPVVLTPKDGVPGIVDFNATLIDNKAVNVIWNSPSITNVLSPKLLRYIIDWKITGHRMGQSVTLTYNTFMFTIMIDQYLVRGQTYEISVFAISTAEERGPAEIRQVSIPQLPTSKSSRSSTTSISRSSIMVTSTSERSITSDSAITSSSNQVTITPSIGAITPGDPVSMQVVILIIVLSLALLLLFAISVCFMVQCIWWRKRGTKGNYSPEKIEEQIEREAMMSVVPKPVAPPSPQTTPPPKMSSSSNAVRALLASTSDSVAADSISQLSVEVIRVDSLYSSRDDLCDQTTNKHSKL